MTTYEALSLVSQFNLVLLGVITIVVMLFVANNKKK
ncbi:putative holin-like toxin [Bacillus suaedaesalsae]|nr:putative holin-like toxin [Bacillus suaedaesalsae]